MYKILIRPLELSDSEISWKWRNDEEVWKYTGNRPNLLVTPEIEREWLKNVIELPDSRRFAITVDDKYVGNIQLTKITSENAEYHIFIGDKDYWGKGVGYSATQQILRFAQIELKLKQVYLFVKKENEIAVKLYRSCGFVQSSNEGSMFIDLVTRNQPMVSVFCMVYNHQIFLEQCLNGILMQKCLFDFEIVVGEDCSKDKSRDILLKYQSRFPGKFKLLLHDQNIGAVNNQELVFSNCTGKYVAICEGDDYWIDPFKLQSQVDFLENNPEYGLVHTDLSLLNQRTGKVSKRVEKNESNVNLSSSDVSEMIAYGSYSIYTCTVLFRKELLIKFDNNNYQMLGDLPLFLHLSEVTRFKFLDCVTSVYRMHFDSATRPKSLLEKIAFEISAIEASLDFLTKTKREPSLELKNKFRIAVIKFHKLTGLNLGKTYNGYFTPEELVELNNPGNLFVRRFRLFCFQAKNFRHNFMRLYYFVHSH